MTTIADVIAIVESANNQNAIRFEPLTYNNNQNTYNNTIANIIKIHNCSEGTARMIYCSSWGKYQIMGFNLYNVASCNCAQSVINYCNNNGIQDMTFFNFLKSVHLDPNIYTPQALAQSSQLRQAFGKVYNGNGPAYEVVIKAALGKLGFNVVN